MPQPSSPSPEQVPSHVEAQLRQPFDERLHNLQELSSEAFAAAEKVPDNDAAQLESIYRAGNMLAESVGSNTRGDNSPLRVAQESLETGYASGDQMGEIARELSVQLNRAERSQKGLPPLSFEQALDELTTEARVNVTTSDEAIRQEGLSMGHFASSLRREPPIRTCNDALLIIETRLKEYAQAPDKTPLHQEQVDSWRAQRDALWHKRTELQTKEQAAVKAADEKPAHDAAVDQARQRVLESFDASTPPSGAAMSASEGLTTTAQIELGNRLGQVVNDLRDGTVASRFVGLRELSDSQRVVLTRELQQVRKQFMGLGADKKPYHDAIDNLVSRYTSGELFSDK